MTITIEKQGRRHYLRGNTWPIKDQLRSLGCKWDPAAKMWWTGKAEVAERAAALDTGESQPSNGGEGKREAPGESATVAGRATYKGRTYYLAGRVDRGRTHYDDRVSPVEARTGKMLLYARDGSFQFWADPGLVEVVASYDRPKTIGGLRRYAAEMREAKTTANGMGTPREDGVCSMCGQRVRAGQFHDCEED